MVAILQSSCSRVSKLASGQLRPGDLVCVIYSSGYTFVRNVHAALSQGLVPVFLPKGFALCDLLELAAGLGAEQVWGATRTYSIVEKSLFRRESALRLSAAMHSGPAVCLSTSGSSGVPRFVLHSFESLKRNAKMHLASIGPGAETLRQHIVLPLNYSTGFVAQYLAAMLTETEPMIYDEALPADWVNALRASEKDGIVHLTPMMVERLKEDGVRALSQPMVLCIGGDHVSEEAWRIIASQRLGSALRGQKTFITYGLTEAGPRVSTRLLGSSQAYDQGNVGRAIDGVELSILGGGPGEGEIAVQTNTANIGVFNLRGERLSGGSEVIRTGDTGTLDSRGVLRVASRSQRVQHFSGELPESLQRLLDDPLARDAFRVVDVLGDPREGEPALVVGSWTLNVPSAFRKNFIQRLRSLKDTANLMVVVRATAGVYLKR